MWLARCVLFGSLAAAALSGAGPASAQEDECYTGEGLNPWFCGTATDCDLLYCDNDQQCSAGRRCRDRNFFIVEPACDDFPYPFAFRLCENPVTECDVTYKVCVNYEESPCAVVPDASALAAALAALAALTRRRPPGRASGPPGSSTRTGR